MKKILAVKVTIALLLGFAVAHAQTAEEIVAKHIDAIGGKDVLAKLKSAYVEGTVQVMGNDNPNSTIILSGVGYRNESEFNGQKIIQCYTDKGGWMINPMGGSGSAEQMPDDAYKAGKDQLDMGGALFNYADKGSSIALQGKDGNAYKIKLVNKDKLESVFYIDANSFLISKLIRKGNMMGQEVEITVKLSDYRKTDLGFMLPWTTEFDFGGQFSMTSSVKKVELNKTVDPAIFAMPK